ncbi:hypothetical protein V8F33_005027 [Rhypophila sp. PSN 637]
MSSSRSSRSNYSGSSPSSSGSGRGGSSRSSRSSNSRQNIRTLIDSLRTHRVNTLTELCRIERVAASCESEEDSRAFQEPMTTAWQYYVNSNQMLSELRGLTTKFPFCGDIVSEAKMLVDNDPDSNRSWNYAWLVLVKIKDDNLIATYAASEAARPEMWTPNEPSAEDIDALAACFQYEWDMAVNNMLRHWQVSPTWY